MPAVVKHKRFAHGTVLTGPNGQRFASGTIAGSNVQIPDDWPYGEVMEFRWETLDANNGQFQGVYMQVRSGVANSSTIRGMEIEARQSAAVAIGTLEGINGHANMASSSTGNVTNVFGISGETSVDDTYTGTISLIAGVRSKVKTEDGSTISAINAGVTNGSFGFLAENEYVTGGKTMSAVLGAKSTGQGNGFNALIDARGTKTSIHDTDQVTLFIFLDDAGTVITCSYDRSAGALVFA